ncbi:MAG: hypothetical protein AB9903_23375 [Vulcanimicrobiota bacterium]
MKKTAPFSQEDQRLIDLFFSIYHNRRFFKIFRFAGKALGVIEDIQGKKSLIKIGNHKSLYRKYYSFGINQDGLVELRKSGVERIIVPFFNKDGDLSAVYAAPVDYWIENSIPFSSEDEIQLHLPIDLFPFQWRKEKETA